MPSFDIFALVLFAGGGQGVENISDTDIVLGHHVFFKEGVMDNFLDRFVFHDRFDSAQVGAGECVDDPGAIAHADLNSAQGAGFFESGFDVETDHGFLIERMADKRQFAGGVDPFDGIAWGVDAGFSGEETQAVLVFFLFGHVFFGDIAVGKEIVQIGDSVATSALCAFFEQTRPVAADDEQLSARSDEFPGFFDSGLSVFIRFQAWHQINE